MKVNDGWLRGMAFLMLTLCIGLAVGCSGGGGGGGSSDSGGGGTTYSISGQVTSNGNGLNGVTITLSGTMSGTTNTTSYGNYSFSSLPTGSYTITPSLSGYTFSPSSETITVSSDQSNINFTGTSVGTDSITVTSPNGGENWHRGSTQNITWSSTGASITSVSIMLYKGGSYSTTIVSSTSNDGSYSWTISSSQTTGSDYKVRISKYGDSSIYDESNSNFTISGYSVSGQVTSGGTGLGGVTITLREIWMGEFETTTLTNSNGDYSFTGVPNDSYSVTPSLSGYTFDPASRTVTINGSDVSGVDFSTSSGSNSVTQTIGTSGGTIELSGGLKIVIPSNALSSSQSITIEKLSQAPAIPDSSDYSLLGSYYEFSPAGLTFNSDVSFILPYKESDIPSGYSETSLTELCVIHYDQDSNGEVLFGQVDATNNTITVKADHFSGMCAAVNKVESAYFPGYTLTTNTVITFDEDFTNYEGYLTTPDVPGDCFGSSDYTKGILGFGPEDYWGIVYEPGKTNKVAYCGAYHNGTHQYGLNSGLSLNNYAYKKDMNSCLVMCFYLGDATSAKFEFDLLTSNGGDNGDYVVVEASQTGNTHGPGTYGTSAFLPGWAWRNLVIDGTANEYILYTNSVSNPTWTAFSYTLDDYTTLGEYLDNGTEGQPAYVGNSYSKYVFIRIRFHSDSDNNVGIGSFVDDIKMTKTTAGVNAPTVSITSHSNNQSVSTRTITVAGTVSDNSISEATLTVNGISQKISVSNGAFSNVAVLKSGSNTIRVTASNSAGTGSSLITVNSTVDPVTISVTLTWDKNDTDADLYVTEPNGETAYTGLSPVNGTPITSNGGELDVDDTDGYGPENYYISSYEGDNIQTGNYEVRVHYYTDNVDTIGGSNGAISPSVTVIVNEGQSNETITTFTGTITTSNYSTYNPGDWNTDTSSWWHVHTIAIGTTDTEDPTVSITNPNPGETVNGTVTIEATASDNVGVTKVVFEVFEGSSYQYAGEDTTSPYSVNWDTTQFSDGEHNIHATAYDAAGNSSLAGIAVTVENVGLQLIATYDSYSAAASGLAWSGSNIWSIVCNATSTVSEKIFKYASNMSVLASYFPPVNDYPSGLTWDGSNMWSGSPGKIYKHGSNMSVIATYDVSTMSVLSDLAWDGSNIWSSNRLDGKIYKHGADLAVSATYNVPSGYYVTGLTWAGSNLWSCGYILSGTSSIGKIYKHGSNLSVIATYDAPSTFPTGLTRDGTNLWSCDYTKIYKHGAE